MDKQPAVSIEHLDKTFKLPHEKYSSIKSALVNFYRKRSYERQRVLKDVSLQVNRGEFFGIVGRNGSGKSTLLKLIAGIYTADKGRVRLHGKLTPFIELGVGFNPELTGRENVFLNGALLGFNRKEMLAMYDDIVSFAELERFMDQKLKNYSSGMQVRLAFSIAIRAQSDILLIDEVLAVGDAAFQQKCYEVFAELKKRGITMILVTHDMSAVLRFCDRAALIAEGEVALVGAPREVADAYLQLNYEAEAHSAGDDQAPKDQPSITKVQIRDDKGRAIKACQGGQTIRATLHYTNPKGLPLHFGFQIFNEAGTYCFGTNTSVDGQSVITAKRGEVSMHLALDLMPGNYTITVATMNDNATTVHSYQPKMASFMMTQDTGSEGIARLTHHWGA